MRDKRYLKFEDDCVHEKVVYDIGDVLNLAHMSRELCNHPFSEYKVLSVVPLQLGWDWVLKAGLSPSDPESMEVIDKKLRDPDFKNLRIWNGEP